ncbi:sensor histidine kinase [Streptomyces sp. NPDC059009]|uniref:sensor histidine kinase n=1 Tax=Streptomyces sp. NPDC059009 TaxID=3346694 RepID=UPI0036C145B9
MHTFGRPPQGRRAILTKSLWIGIWLVFLASPAKDLADGHHSGPATLLGWFGLTAFAVCYLTLVFRYTTKIIDWGVVLASIALLFVLAVVLAFCFGDAWLGLFVYVAVSVAAVLPMRYALWAIPGVTLVMILVGLRDDGLGDLITNLGIITLLVGFAMTGVRELVRTTIQLRQARATVAQLAANEERLRLARDLHDLLGHSLSLITLKSELAGRMLPDHPDKAAQQVADIEQVSRQALVDVRQAVTGYRRRTLAGELAGARTALTAAGVEADVPLEAERLPGREEETALAWALREAVTNVVRHSGARRCTVTLAARETLGGPVLQLTVTDDGTGPGGAPGGAAPGNGNGNGLTGLTERLAAVGGVLETAPAPGRGSGFQLTARVPLTAGEGDAPGAQAPAIGSPA